MNCKYKHCFTSQAKYTSTIAICKLENCVLIIHEHRHYRSTIFYRWLKHPLFIFYNPFTFGPDAVTRAAVPPETASAD